jgi:hypothetical protein
MKAREEVEACEQSCRKVEDDSKAKSEDILALVKSAAHTRTLITSVENQKRRYAVIQQKREKLKQLEASVLARQAEILEEETHLKALEASEGQVESRVLSVLAKDSQWKSLHYHDLRQILGSIQRISDKEAQLKRGGQVPNRLSV